MADEAEEIDLAPLDGLIDILPKIEKAKERARLGTALQKATASAERFHHVPSLLDGLGVLVGASDGDLEDLRSEIEVTLNAVVKMARLLAGELSVDDLDQINQSGLIQLPLQVDKITTLVESTWRRTVQDALSGQAALGEVLTNIPGVERLGRDLTRLADRAKRLEDTSRPAAERVTERDKLVAEASALSDRLHGAGIAPPIASFLVAVADGPVRLSDMTDDVLAWIKDHEALALFTVSARGT